MKTNILYSAILALIISSILSSCAFMQKGEFTQRKYYNFPRANHSVNAEKTDFTVFNQQKGFSPTVVAEEKIKTPELIITASAGEKIILISKRRTELVSKKNNIEKNLNATTTNLLPPDNSVFSLKKSEIRKFARQKLNDSKSSDADT